jgi:hypothetical protein
MAKTLTPKEVARKALNERLTEARNARLKAEQTLARELKLRFGYVGTPDQILRQHYLAQAEKQRLERLAAEILKQKEADLKRDQEALEQTQYVTEALNGPSGKVLRAWLAGREPAYGRVKRFFDERPNQFRTEQKYVAPKAA